jgi:HSP20 family molecular chaperone IbpA
MNDEERERPIGIEALNEMGRRLLDVLGSVEKAFKGDQTSQTRSFTIKTPRGRLVGNVGFAVRHGITPEQPDRTPTRRQAPAPQSRIDGSDEHLIDVFDEPAEIMVTIAPCTIAARELAVRVEGAVLHIEATGGRRFRKQVPLPRDLGGVVPAVRLSNGILEIRIPKPTDPVPPPSSSGVIP